MSPKGEMSGVIKLLIIIVVILILWLILGTMMGSGADKIKTGPGTMNPSGELNSARDIYCQRACAKPDPSCADIHYDEPTNTTSCEEYFDRIGRVLFVARDKPSLTTSDGILALTVTERYETGAPVPGAMISSAYGGCGPTNALGQVTCTFATNTVSNGYLRILVTASSYPSKEIDILVTS